jgi:hypothetical protein
MYVGLVLRVSERRAHFRSGVFGNPRLLFGLQVVCLCSRGLEAAGCVSALFVATIKPSVVQNISVSC